MDGRVRKLQLCAGHKLASDPNLIGDNVTWGSEGSAWRWVPAGLGDTRAARY